MFAKYCTSACRVFILIAIIAILGYVAIQNNKTVEKFTTKPQEVLDKYETIRTTFKRLLFRDPTNNEYKVISEKMSTTSDTSTIIAIINTMEEYKSAKLASDEKDIMFEGVEFYNSPIMRELQTYDANRRLNTYKDVTQVYNTILGRMPNSKELSYYSLKLLKNVDFTLEKLRIILMGSVEFKIAEKNQSNIVHGDLSGNITDAQLTLQVRKLYNSVFDLEMPSKEFEDFLKEKYIEYSLDDPKLLNLLLFLKKLDSNQIETMEDGKVKVEFENNMLKKPNISSSKLVNNISSEMIDEEQINEEQDAVGTSIQKPSSQQSTTNIINIINPSQEDMQKIMQTLQPVNQNSSSLSTKDAIVNSESDRLGDSSVPMCYAKQFASYTDPFTLSMMKNKGECVYNKNARDMALINEQRSKNQLTERINSRQTDDTRAICKPENYNVIDNASSSAPMSYDEYVQFGTPLEIAKLSYVGSMGPTYVSV